MENPLGTFADLISYSHVRFISCNSKDVFLLPVVGQCYELPRVSQVSSVCSLIDTLNSSSHYSL